jgi:golgi reassembly-stacking protein
MILGSTNDVWHILDVAANSPADSAGILPYGDYIIGSPEGIMRGESGLSELVEDVSFLHYLTEILLIYPST